MRRKGLLMVSRAARSDGAEALPRFIFAPFLAMVAVILAGLVVRHYDRLYPPPLPAGVELSREVTARDGRLLRAFAAADGRWRLKVRERDVDPAFVRMLLAWEDSRFHWHFGIDPLSLARAAWQYAVNGRVISGGSTITMQLARLLEGRRNRTIGDKLRQMARAVQLEMRLSKAEILSAYLTLAPYGGNLEGVRAASYAWFGHGPEKLAPHEAALLVALPQAPEARRPDLHPKVARAARDRILQRLARAGAVDAVDAAHGRSMPVPARRAGLPAHAAHLAAALARSLPPGGRVRSSVDLEQQMVLEALARDWAGRHGPPLSLAMILLDGRTGEIRASLGAADPFDGRRRGWVDMTRAIRSPGSALKPFIYALAFDAGIAQPETLIEDAPVSFGGYRPGNFDHEWHGTVSVREALARSLNVPAVMLLDSVGPVRLLSVLRRGGADVRLPRDKAAGLPVALGGVGISLRGLSGVYTAFVNGGVAMRPRARPDGKPHGVRILQERAAWQVMDILRDAAPPPDTARLPIAYKTGTSYGFRDAWSVGFNGRYVLGVWVGRADGVPVPGIMGRISAAPVLFSAFSRLGLSAPFAPRPQGAAPLRNSQLPAPLRRFVARGALPRVGAGVIEAPPRIAWPRQGAHVELPRADGGRLALAVKIQDGRAPFRVLVNGRPGEGLLRRRQALVRLDGKGFNKVTVIDAAGRSASVRIFLN